MESGPRALGGRSILFDPRKPENKDIINMRVKFREPFRPFCPSIMEEYANEYLSPSSKDRYMITACNVKDEKRNEEIAQIKAQRKFDPEAFGKSLKAAAGVFTAENHPEWRTKKDVIEWLQNSRKAADRKF